jgi:glycosyltransferase involved in cell wall biosynthesis
MALENMRILQLIDLYKTGGAEKVYDMFSQYCYTRNISVERLVLYGEKAENDEKQYIISKEHTSLLRKLIDQYRCICSVHKLIRRKEISRLVGFLDRSNLVFVFAFLFDSKRPEITATVHNPPTIQYLKINTFIRRIFLESLSWAYNRKWVKVIAVSEDVKDSLSSIGVRNVQVIHNPVSFRQDAFELPLAPIEEYLIAIGRLEYQKGYWKLLKAFA